MSIKPAPGSWSSWEEIKKANSLIEDYCQKDENLSFVDLSVKLLAKNGRPNPRFYLDDNMHLNALGDALIAKLVSPAINN